MSDYTYESENKVEPLEKYQWGNVWWENARSVGVPRALYIGDSISCATRRFATAAEEKMFFDGIGTSKAVDNPHFPDLIRSFTKQEPERCSVMLFLQWIAWMAFR